MQPEVPVYINGLFPNLVEEENVSGSSIMILDPELSPSDSEFVLLRGDADEKGIFQNSISSELINKKVTLRVFHVNFQEHEVDVIIQDYGLYHSVKLEKCHVYTPQPKSQTWQEWDSSIQYTRALSELQKIALTNPQLKTAESSQLSREEFKALIEKTLNFKIKDYVYEEFLQELEGVEMTSFVASSVLNRMLAKNISAEYTTIQYYEFILLQNFTRLMSNIDQHVLYGLSDRFLIVTPYITFFNIEINANFINYLEAFAGLGTCMMEFKKNFSDDQFDLEYGNLVSNMPATNGILRKIRNKYHHARGFRLTQMTFQSSYSNDVIRKYVIPLGELLNNIDDWSKKERLWLESEASNGYIDIKSLVVDHYQFYTLFLNRYRSHLINLVRRKTGCEIRLSI